VDFFGGAYKMQRISSRRKDEMLLTKRRIYGVDGSNRK